MERAREPDRDEDPKAELARLHAKLAELADGHANASELWKVVEQIRDVRARM
jgi:hypothetical protein